MSRTHPQQSVDLDSFREAFSRIPTPVTVVTTLLNGLPHGTTVSAICSLSADPPLILVSLARDSELLRLIKESRRFAVNVLRDSAEEVARACARKGDDKFDGITWYEEDGLPRITPEATWLSCDLYDVIPQGDHNIVIGLVRHCDPRAGGTFVYWRRTLIPIGERLWRERKAEPRHEEDRWLDEWPMGLR